MEKHVHEPTRNIGLVCVFTLSSLTTLTRGATPFLDELSQRYASCGCELCRLRPHRLPKQISRRCSQGYERCVESDVTRSAATRRKGFRVSAHNKRAQLKFD